MKTRNVRKLVVFNAVLAIALGVAFSRTSFVQNNVSHAQAKTGPALPSPTPPKKEDEVTLNSDDVVRVETNLTNVFFTAADKQKRFVSTLKKEDIRILEDGVPQEIFAFQPNSDLPLSIAILIDCSGSEERTLPMEKDAARSFLESVLRPEKDEAAIVSFTGEVTLEQGLTGNIGRLRRAIDEVRFVPPAGYLGGGVVVGESPISEPNSISGVDGHLGRNLGHVNELLSASADTRAGP